MPAGRSNSTRHEVMADEPPLVISYSPCQPDPQSVTLVKVAVVAAAEAGLTAYRARPAATTAAARARINERVRRMDVLTGVDGRPIIREVY